MRLDRNNRFHLEELIQHSWQTKDDLESILWKIYDDSTAPTEDELHNALLGVVELHNIRSRRLMDCFEEMLKNGTIKSDG